MNEHNDSGLGYYVGVGLSYPTGPMNLTFGLKLEGVNFALVGTEPALSITAGATF